MKAIKILLLSLLIGVSSCTKDDDICGIVSDGDIEYNELLGEYDYYLYIDGDKRYVSEKTYSSFFIGDVICLEY